MRVHVHCAGATWHYVGGDDSVGNDFDPTITKEPFYSSGFNDEFVIINGVYNPTIAMQACLPFTKCSCCFIPLHPFMQQISIHDHTSPHCWQGCHARC